jgi:hypothetical protein
VRCRDEGLAEGEVSSHSSTTRRKSKYMSVTESTNSDPSVDLVSWMNSRAAALSRVSADTTTVVVRVQLSPGRLTLDLSKHLF